MVHGDFKDFSGRTATDKLLRDKPFNTAKNTKNVRYHSGFFFFSICIFFIRNDKPKNTNSAFIHKQNSIS